MVTKRLSYDTFGLPYDIDMGDPLPQCTIVKHICLIIVPTSLRRTILIRFIQHLLLDTRGNVNPVSN